MAKARNARKRRALLDARTVCYFCRPSIRLNFTRRTSLVGQDRMWFIRGENRRKLNPIRLIEIDNARHNVAPQTLIIALGLCRLRPRGMSSLLRAR